MLPWLPGCRKSGAGPKNVDLPCADITEVELTLSDLLGNRLLKLAAVWMKRFVKLCRAASITLVFWILALRVPASEPVHLMILLVGPVSTTVDTLGSLSPKQSNCDASFFVAKFGFAVPTQAPLLALVAFGCYLLVLLIAGALSFRTCPEDAKDLQEVRLLVGLVLPILPYQWDIVPVLLQHCWCSFWGLKWKEQQLVQLGMQTSSSHDRTNCKHDSDYLFQLLCLVL